MTARPDRRERGGRAFREGHGAEWIAALWLMLKGYQILAFRLRGRAGEIDLLARKGRVLAVVEVKRRATLEAALEALSPAQAARLAASASAVRRGRPALSALQPRLDLIALAPGRLPRHRRGVAPPTSG